MRNIFPSKKQWLKWTLPSKLGVISAYITIFLVLKALLIFMVSLIPDNPQVEPIRMVSRYDKNKVELTYSDDGVNLITPEYKFRIDNIFFEKEKYQKILEKIKNGLYYFKVRRDYEASAQLFHDAYKLSKSRKNQKALQQLITASYYGGGLHRKGIKFICEKYKFLPSSDYRHRFDFHAHIRQLSIKEGSNSAISYVTKLKKTCHRDDLSVIWTGITLQQMEDLQQGKLFVFHGIGENKDYLQWLIENYSNDTFIDHAYYFIGRSDLIYNKYPHSLIREPAAFNYLNEKSNYYSALEFYDSIRYEWTNSRYHQIAEKIIVKLLGERLDIELFYRFSSEHPEVNKLELLSALQIILSDIILNNNTFILIPTIKEKGYLSLFKNYWEAEALKNATLLKEYSLEEILQISTKVESTKKISDYLWKSNLDTGTELLRAGKYSHALQRYNNQVALFSKYSHSPNDLLKKRVELVSTLKQLQKQRNRHFLSGILLRKRSSISSIGTSALEFSLNEFSRCLKDSEVTWLHGKCMFLKASTLRRMKRYNESKETFIEFTEKFESSSNLIDDALAEIGVHYLLVEYNFESALPYFEKVYKNYPNHNAADNALNWVAWYYFKQGEYRQALYFYSYTAVNYASNRLGQRAKEMKSRLEKMATPYIPWLVWF